MFSLTDQVYIVTGASRGIGEAIAHALAEQGAKVLLSSRRLENVAPVAEALKAKGLAAEAVACHMGKPEQISQMLDFAIEKFGRLDGVVNNAATNPSFGPIQDTTAAEYQKIMQVNVEGPLQLCQLAYPYLKKNGSGSIVNISSVEGLTPAQGLGLYSMSKAALISLTKTMAKEWGADGIRANVIAPGIIETKFSQALTQNKEVMQYLMARQGIKRVGTPDEVAGLAVLLCSAAGGFCTGGIYTADGGYTI